MRAARSRADSNDPRHAIGTLVGALLLGIVAGCDRPEPPAAPEPVAAPTARAPLRYVRTAACVECHADVAGAWTGSHHDRAMEVASPDSVVGDFADAELTVGDVTSRFFRKDDRYLVHTQDTEGTLRDFEVQYTFGVDPLQQYLVAQPNGRLHALTLAWDDRPAADGGQRWFDLNDEPAPPGDVMHWMGPTQRWNTTCASCHSTRLRKGFDLASETYDTTWSDVDVGCEACHGPGSRHVAWAERRATGDASPDDTRGLTVDLRADGGRWVMNATTGIARRSRPRETHREVDTCAPCHARRTQLREADPGVPFLDAHRPALLEPGLYHADGQIDEEVYVWGSFVQSRMYRAGVTCTDCHDPHTLAVRGGTEGVCHQCHDAARFATRAHHRHEPGTAGSACVDCHMPARTYMQIDPRRDHSFVIPRPDLTASIGTPNPCNGCHDDRSPEWAARIVAEWPGVRQAGTAHFAETLTAAARGEPNAPDALAELGKDADAAGIVRATALALLAGGPPNVAAEAIRSVRGDADPLVRFGAARAATAVPPPDRPTLLAPLLADAVRLVRSEAGRALAGTPPAALGPDDQRRLHAALATYRADQMTNADQPSAHVNLGLLAMDRRDPTGAERAYRHAIEVGPWFLPAYVNLADLYRATERDTEGEAVLLRARELGPQVAEVHHALGLLRVRQRRLDDAIASLATATRLAPENPRFAYVYAVALHTAGRVADAIGVLREASTRHPHDRAIQQALTGFEGAAARE